MTNQPSKWTKEDDIKWEKDTQQTQMELDSELILPSIPYSTQAETVRSCVRVAFWEYAWQIRITNRFIFDLKRFMESSNNLNEYKWDKNDAKWKALIEDLISEGDQIVNFIISNTKGIYRQIKSDLTTKWMSEDEAKKQWRKIFDKFLFLLRERINISLKESDLAIM